ncbi:MAG: phosphoribosylamine--glycine ligase [Phycisphaerales bacterium]
MPCPARVNVLVVGTGGREHALAWKLRQSPRIGDLWVDPGANAGLLAFGRPCPETLDPQRRFFLQRWCEKVGIQLVVIGPDNRLAEGLTDDLQKVAGCTVFGPTRAAARIEWDKAWAKQLMRQVAVPCAEGRTFDTLESAVRYVVSRDEPMVVKASGLCLGKGVFVCDGREEALEALEQLMEKRVMGEAGATVVIEERLEGQELSVLALVDGSTIWVLDPAQDHKRVGEGDTGPNTGGMGAYCPTPLATPELLDLVQRDILVPTVDALRLEGCAFRGVLYAGLMLTPGGPKVLEFNARFGDPETQTLMARLRGDLLEILWRTATGELDGAELSFDPRTACCVSVCAQGYPGTPRSGDRIEGLEDAVAAAGPGEEVVLFHAGTARDANGALVTRGGRVLGVTALAADLAAAQALANRAASLVRFEGAFFRRDIGSRVLGGAGIPGTSPRR